MRGLIQFLIVAAGFLLMFQLFSPLYVFLRDSETGIRLETSESNGVPVIIVYYDVRVPLTDVVVEVRGDGAEYAVEAEKLEAGDRLEIPLPAEAGDGIEGVRISAKIGGIYGIELELRFEGGG